MATNDGQGPDTTTGQGSVSQADIDALKRARDEAAGRSARKITELESQLSAKVAEVETLNTQFQALTARRNHWKEQTATTLKQSRVDTAIARSGISDPDIAGLVRRELFAMESEVDLENLTVSADYDSRAGELASKLVPKPEATTTNQESPPVVGIPPNGTPQAAPTMDAHERMQAFKMGTLTYGDDKS